MTANISGVGGVGGVGGVTEKTLNKPDEQDFDKHRDGASLNDTAQFDALMNNGTNAENDVNPASEKIVFNEAPSNAGDKILDAFMGMKENITTRHDDITKMLGGEGDGAMSMRDMLSSQRALSNLSMTEDLIAKIVGKTTQNLDTMMKQQ
ncbi:MAG: type III secretion system inner rod subunit SctI [Endozoicomonadaceae bacterium]|nr:type III secretion system inner rod subunit SctI [Endozoicomonadaceae bacterium]